MISNRDFAEKNLGRIYVYNGLLVEVVGYTYDDQDTYIYTIVRYLSPDKARGCADSWGKIYWGDVVEKCYATPGSVYSYATPGHLKPVSYREAVRAFAEAYKGVKFDLNGKVVTVVGYCTSYSAVIVALTQGGRRMVGPSDFILFNSEQKTFEYADYRTLKPIRK